MSLFVGKVQFLSLDSLTSLAFPFIVIHSRLTMRSKYEHKHRGNWARNVYKVIIPLESEIIFILLSKV